MATLFSARISCPTSDMAYEDMTVADLHADIEEILNGPRMLDALFATRFSGLADENAKDEARTS